MSPGRRATAFRLEIDLPGFRLRGWVEGDRPPVRVTPAPVALSWHRGHGPGHHDLLLGVGLRCPTISLVPVVAGGRDGRVSGRVSFPHRRRYLGFSGPVPGGRGEVAVRFRGLAIWFRVSGGLRVTTR